MTHFTVPLETLEFTNKHLCHAFGINNGINDGINGINGIDSMLSNPKA